MNPLTNLQMCLFIYICPLDGSSVGTKLSFIRRSENEPHLPRINEYIIINNPVRITYFSQEAFFFLVVVFYFSFPAELLTNNNEVPASRLV